MKFGRSLQDHLVPEWRDQYLDYKQGKKKLKKMTKKSASSTHAANTPLIPQHSSALGHTVRPMASFREEVRTEDGYEDNDDYQNNNDGHSDSKSTGRDQITLETQSTSFALPSAILPIDVNYNNALNDKNSKLSPDDPLSKKKLIESTPLLGSTTPLFDPKRKKSIAAQVFDTFMPSLNAGSSKDVTELEDLAQLSRQQFIAWVDSELFKVDDFYLEREDACTSRILILQDQLNQLEQQKQQSKERWLIAKQIRNNGSNNAPVDDEYDSDDEYDEAQLEEFSNTVLGAAQRNFRFWSFWTKRKLRIINKFDMPSLPSFEWLKKDGKVEKQYYDDGYYSEEENDIAKSQEQRKKDYVKRKKSQVAPHVPYFVGKRMLKKAVYEVYHAMEMLKSYKLMNRTAFRKMIKKYDKATGEHMLNSYMEKVDNTHFVKSEVLDTLMTHVEEMWTQHFEHGNRKAAITKLRSNPSEETFYFSNYLSGLFLGLGIPIFIYAVYLGVYSTLSGKLENGEYLLQIWGGFFIVVLISLLFGINCLVWSRFKVNYKFIFEFNQRDTLDFKQYLLIPSILFFWLALIGWFSFENFWPDELTGRNFPWLFLGVALVVIICPFDIFYLNARLWLISSLFRLLLSGFYPVEFRDFFLGDIFSSLTYSISNLSTFFCLYSIKWNNCIRCGSSRSRVLGFLQCLPSIWRFLQCFRRWADTGEWFPHLANMGKYTVSMLYYMSLSLYRIEKVSKYRVLLIFWATFNSVYSSIWDLIMDWSLVDFDSENFLLRDELVFKNKNFYYFAMISDVILRFQWVFYVLFPSYIQQSAVTSFGVALAEIIRRFIWIFFRMENEHATNVHLYRASRESPLPYPTAKRRTTLREADYSHLSSSDITDQQMPESSGVSFGTGTGTGISGAHVDASLMGTPNMIHRRATVATLRSRVSSVTGEIEPQADVEGLFNRYLSTISRTLRSAHVKDFQRRKVDKKKEVTQEVLDDVDVEDGE
ncbi:Syg1 protein [Martiniozyma asiatica (nom. inval.)]|nr:Syg1 protein [Martiniozyma asiatica]